MPSKSPKQKRLMAACANPKARRTMKKCPPLKVAKEFHQADKRKKKAARKSRSY